MSEIDVEVANGYFIQEPTWDNSIFSCFFNQKFFSCENSKKKLTFFKDRLFEIRQKIPFNDLVKDKLFKHILVTYFQSIDRYAKNNFSKKDKSFMTDLFSVFKEFIMYDDKNYFLNFFLLTVALPVLNLIVQDVPTKEWYKKYLLNTFNFILKQQTKKNRTLYTNMMESNLVLKLLDNLYLSTDIGTQFKILETVKLTCWKKELIVDLEYYFPRNQTLQDKFKIFLTSGRDRDFINTFNELNKNIKIYSIMVENVLLGNKFLNSEDDDFYLDINWASQSMTLFVNPLCFYNSPPSFSQDSHGNYKIKYIETICVPFNIIDTIDNSYTKKDSKIVYYIDITLNAPCEYELETSKQVVENSKKLKIITKPVLQTQGVILERYFRKYFQEKYKFKIFSMTGRTDCLNINIHKVCSANSSLGSEPLTSFLHTVTETNMFVKTKRNLLPVNDLEPVVEEEINDVINMKIQDLRNIQNTTFITEDTYEHFSVTGDKDKDMEKNTVWASAEIQINSISSNGITGQENVNDKISLTTSSNKISNAVDDLLYGKQSQINDSIFKIIEKDSPNRNTQNVNSPKVKILTPVDLNERYERLNSQKNSENDDVISNSYSEESYNTKHFIQTNEDNDIVINDNESISNDNDGIIDVNGKDNETRKYDQNADDSESDAESVVSRKSFQHHDFMVDTRNILSKRLRTKRQKKYYLNDEDHQKKPQQKTNEIEVIKKTNKKDKKKKNDGYVTDMEDNVNKKSNRLETEETTIRRSSRNKNKGYISDVESVNSIKSNFNSDLEDKSIKKSRRKSDEDSGKILVKKARRKSAIDYDDTDCDEIIPKRKEQKTKKIIDDKTDSEDALKISKLTKNKRMINVIRSESEDDEIIPKMSKNGSDMENEGCNGELITVENKKINSDRSNRNKYVSSDSEREVCRGFETDEDTKRKMIFTSKKTKTKKMHGEQSPFFSKDQECDKEKNEDCDNEKNEETNRNLQDKSKNKLNINGTVYNVNLDSKVVKDLKQKQLKVKINSLERMKGSRSVVNNPVSKTVKGKKKCNSVVGVTSTDVFVPFKKDVDMKITSKGTKRKLFNPKDDNFEYFNVVNETVHDNKTINKTKNKNVDKDNIKCKNKSKGGRIVDDDIFNKLKNNEDVTSPLKSQRTKTKDRHNKIVTVYKSLFGAGDVTQSVEGSCGDLSVSPFHLEMEPLHTETDLEVDDIEMRAENIDEQNDEQNFNSILLDLTPKKNINPRKTSTPHNSDYNSNSVYETFAKTLNMHINLKEEETCSCSKRGGLYSNLYVSSLMFKQSFADYIMCDNHDALADDKIKQRQEIYKELVERINYIINKIENEFR